MIKINTGLIEQLTEKSLNSDRKRANYNFHKEYSDLLQRMLQVIQPGSYIQPHKHENPDKREAFLILKGKIVAFEFDNDGKIVDYIVLCKETGNYGVEFAERVWHSLIALEPDSVFYEVKDGPYLPMDDKNFATWAPKEGDPNVNEYMKKLLNEINY